MLLLCSFLRLEELFQVKNGVTTSFLYFYENAKNLGRSDDGKRRKKKDGLIARKDVGVFLFCFFPFKFFSDSVFDM